MTPPSSSAAGPRHDYEQIWQEAYGDMQDVGPVHRHMRRLIRGMLAPLTYDSALEVGVGAGHNLELLREGRTLDRLAGADIAEQALMRAREREPADYHRLDIEEGRLPGSWDLVFCSLVLEHLPDDVSALQNMAAMARKHVLVTTIAGDFERYRPWEEQMGHVRNYRRGELEERMRAAGLTVRRAVYWGYPFYTPLARTLQNRMTSEPSYGLSTRVLAEVMYRLYFLNSRRRGDLLVLLADKA
jgi:trans-aconitate methyltransferase